MKEIPIWFPGARLNYAENLLSRNDNSIACTASSELGQVTHCSYRELRERVRIMASALRLSGVRVGDRVAGKFIPMFNGPENEASALQPSSRIQSMLSF